MSLVAGPGRAGLDQKQLPEKLHLVVEKHVSYIRSLDTRRDEYEYWLTEHLRLNGLYWGLTALQLLDHPDALPHNEVVDFVISCWHTTGGFGAAPGHDPHMLYTVSAVQILISLDALNKFEERVSEGKERIVKYIASLQNSSSGAFDGDEWGESDTRFLFGAFLALSLLNRLDAINVTKAVEHVVKCANFDGGFGTEPGAESHSGQIYTCLGALSIAKRLDLVDKDKLGTWLSDRQLPSGGLNGRPEKTEDVCYSWWVMASLAMIDRLHWIDQGKLSAFILGCQDMELGGLADRPGDMVDVFHTVFGIAGLSLMQHPGLVQVNSIYCMPQHVITKVLPT